MSGALCRDHRDYENTTPSHTIGHAKGILHTLTSRPMQCDIVPSTVEMFWECTPACFLSCCSSQHVVCYAVPPCCFPQAYATIHPEPLGGGSRSVDRCVNPCFSLPCWITVNTGRHPSGHRVSSACLSRSHAYVPLHVCPDFTQKKCSLPIWKRQLRYKCPFRFNHAVLRHSLFLLISFSTLANLTSQLELIFALILN